MTAELEISVFRPARPGIRKVLGDLAADIMEIVWTRPVGEGTTVRDVFEPLYERRHSAYTTIMNTMTRLARKNLLRAEKHEQAYVYYPTLTQDEFVTRFVGRILENLLVGFAGATRQGVEALPDPAAAARANRLVDEIARRRTAEEGRSAYGTAPIQRAPGGARRLPGPRCPPAAPRLAAAARRVPPPAGAGRHGRRGGFLLGGTLALCFCQTHFLLFFGLTIPLALRSPA